MKSLYDFIISLKRCGLVVSISSRNSLDMIPSGTYRKFMSDPSKTAATHKLYDLCVSGSSLKNE
jgi:hypothetical protein